MTATYLTSGGERLPSATRGFFGTRLGIDLDGVRVHRGHASARAAQALQAHAFTYANHVWLGPGTSLAPNHVLAHELVHVAQQRAAPPLRRASESEFRGDPSLTRSRTGGDASPAVVPSTAQRSVMRRLIFPRSRYVDCNALRMRVPADAEDFERDVQAHLRFCVQSRTRNRQGVPVRRERRLGSLDTNASLEAVWAQLTRFRMAGADVVIEVSYHGSGSHVDWVHFHVPTQGGVTGGGARPPPPPPREVPEPQLEVVLPSYEETTEAPSVAGDMARSLLGPGWAAYCLQPLTEAPLQEISRLWIRGACQRSTTGYLHSREYDAFGHCWIACEGTRECGGQHTLTFSRIHEELREAGYGGSHDSRQQDLANQRLGWELAFRPGTCRHLCDAAHQNGTLDLSAPVRRYADCSTDPPRVNLRHQPRAGRPAR